MKPIAVLGTGPAGLMAAHACALAGRPVALFGKSDPGTGMVTKSRLGGAQFLHDPLPLVNDDEEPDSEVYYVVRGESAIYQHKVYGDTYVPFVSMERVHNGQVQPTWNLQATYDKLWEMLVSPDTEQLEINSAWIHKAQERQWFDFILSTIPLPQLCEAEVTMRTHHFAYVEVKIASEPMEVYDNGVAERDYIIYDGTAERSWYRCSSLYGHGGTEWGSHIPTPLDVVKVRKPLRTNCNCHPDVVRLGRYGTWTKGVLTHHAFVEALKAVMA
jgi:hypothetical protein